ncbi:hypothetical protein A2U01_0057800, partial [Trifolium medium]|nr:hypothetical protein [Trifolium medium]
VYQNNCPTVEAKGLEGMWRLLPPSSTNVSFHLQVYHTTF